MFAAKELWFDVGIVRYTTYFLLPLLPYLLWFDVGIVRYTTNQCTLYGSESCGLM